MYKPGNLSAPPPVLTAHQPRLDWQMWFAALGPHTQAPWFSSLLHRLLQGKRDGEIRYVSENFLSPIGTDNEAVNIRDPSLLYVLQFPLLLVVQLLFFRIVEIITDSLISSYAVIELIQADVSNYPFNQQPPTYVRAHRYKYWFTEMKSDRLVLLVCSG